VRCLGMIEGRGDFFCAGAGLRTVFREERGGGVALKGSHGAGTLPAGCAVVSSPVKRCAGKMAKTSPFWARKCEGEKSHDAHDTPSDFVFPVRTPQTLPGILFPSKDAHDAPCDFVFPVRTLETLPAISFSQS